MIQSIYVNLPVEDLQRSRDFWTKLGFSFNEAFCDEKALCLMLNEGSICAMLLKREFFATFINRAVADHSTTQVLLAIAVESRQQVDDMVRTALENGATRYREAQDHGWMYYDCIADPDGHQWEIMFSDPNQLPT